MRILASSLALAAALGLAAPANAWEAGDWLVRVGTSNISPKSDNGDIDLSALSLGTRDLEVSDEYGVTFNVTYMFTRNWAFEVLAALPYTHDVKVKGVGQVGEVKHLPPTFSAQYHFLPDSSFQPYVGAGINYTLFFDDKAQGVLSDLDGSLDVDSSSVGLAAQAGFDYMFNKSWFLNVDLRWIDIETDADVTVPGVGTLSQKVDIDPMVYNLNLGYRF